MAAEKMEQAIQGAIRLAKKRALGLSMAKVAAASGMKTGLDTPALYHSPKKAAKMAEDWAQQAREAAKQHLRAGRWDQASIERGKSNLFAEAAKRLHIEAGTSLRLIPPGMPAPSPN